MNKKYFINYCIYNSWVEPLMVVKLYKAGNKYIFSYRANSGAFHTRYRELLDTLCSLKSLAVTYRENPARGDLVDLVHDYITKNNLGNRLKFKRHFNTLPKEFFPFILKHGDELVQGDNTPTIIFDNTMESLKKAILTAGTTAKQFQKAMTHMTEVLKNERR